MYRFTSTAARGTARTGDSGVQPAHTTSTSGVRPAVALLIAALFFCTAVALATPPVHREYNPISRSLEEPIDVDPESDADDGEALTLEQLARTPEFEDVISRSFETILSDTQLVRYRGLAPSELSTYRKRFWLRNDPTPGTEANEFLEEHLRRLEYALQHFCPLRQYEWDQRGDVVLRFGAPDARACEFANVSMIYGGMGLTPSFEVWSYALEEMSVRFIDPNMDGWYQLGFDTKHFTAHGRPEVQVDSRSTEAPYVAPLIPVNVEAEFAKARFHEQEQKGQKVIEEVPVSYAYRPPAEPLPLFYEVVTSRGADGRTDIAVNYQVPTECLSVHEVRGKECASLTKRIRVLREDFEEVTRDARVMTATLGDDTPGPGTPGAGTHGAGTTGPGTHEADHLLTDEWRVDAKPGSYVVGFSVKDTLSGRTGHGRSSIEVPDYSRPGLSMSDIQLATRVTKGARFARMGGSVVPHPIHAFDRDDEMVIYFELYGLREDLPGIGRFTVNMEIVGRNYEEDEGWLSRVTSRLFPDTARHSITSEVLGTGSAPDTAYWFSVSLQNLAQDNYDLTIRVKDVRSKTEVTKSTSFTVLEN